MEFSFGSGSSGPQTLVTGTIVMHGMDVFENRKRYQSRTVVRMTPYNRLQRLPEGVANEEATETEGERQLKVLLTQQLDTNLTIQQQYSRHRSFQPSSTYVPITKELSGQLSSTEFKHYESKKQQVDCLRQMGLDDGEVALKLQQDDSHRQGLSRLGTEPSILKQQLEAIQCKIDNKKSELSKTGPFREAKHLTRHEMDLEKSLKPTSQQSQLLRNLVTIKRPSEETHPADPINYLKDMEQELLERVKMVHRDKKRKLATTNLQGDDSCIRIDSAVAPKRKLDEKVATAMDALLLLGSDLFSKNDPVIRAYVVPIPEEEIEKNRLSLEEIQQIPRFRDYKPGVPSKVLYLKNLASDVGETDLVALFARYQKNPDEMLQYRLMKGKMRGQAFITFPDQAVAMEALHFIHGFKWKGKPIIIQFGHQEDAGNN